MTPTNQFVFNHRLKLAWKLARHGLGVLLMTDQREKPHSLSTAGHTRPKKHDNSMNYLDSTALFNHH